MRPSAPLPRRRRRAQRRRESRLPRCFVYDTALLQATPADSRRLRR